MAGRRGTRAVSPRLGLLRLAPTLSIVTGDRSEARWPVIAGGIGAAMGDGFDARDGFDPDDGPLCA
ncbi:MAG: hypothetical protein L0206_08610 [Actinobacteria bacterium]|nr:hypothetical protein [Actinomycetota bacterium]